MAADGFASVGAGAGGGLVDVPVNHLVQRIEGIAGDVDVHALESDLRLASDQQHFLGSGFLLGCFFLGRFLLRGFLLRHSSYSLTQCIDRPGGRKMTLGIMTEVGVYEKGFNA